MKTSNKLLIGSGICLILGIITHTFILRGAYLDALKNPLANELRIDLKTVKYLNLEYNREVTFRRGNKFEIILNRNYKDSLNIKYSGDSLNLDISEIENAIIMVVEMPKLTFTYAKSKNDEYKINIDSTFQSGSFDATFLKKRGEIYFQKCKFENLDLKSEKSAAVTLDDVSIKNLNLDLKAYSVVNIFYANIQSKNVILGDSSTFNLVGKQTQTIFLK